MSTQPSHSPSARQAAAETRQTSAAYAADRRADQEAAFPERLHQRQAAVDDLVGDGGERVARVAQRVIRPVHPEHVPAARAADGFEHRRCPHVGEGGHHLLGSVEHLEAWYPQPRVPQPLPLGELVGRGPHRVIRVVPQPEAPSQPRGQR
jgi:hypothetical protein